MTKQSHFVFHHCQNTMCDTTAGCQRSSQRSQIVLNSRERHLHRRAIILEILEPFLRQQVQLCVFAGLSVLQRARAVRVAWPQLIVSRTPPMAQTAALPAEQRGAAQRHEVHLTRASRTHRRKEHLRTHVKTDELNPQLLLTDHSSDAAHLSRACAGTLRPTSKHRSIIFCRKKMKPL